MLTRRAKAYSSSDSVV